MKRVLFYACCVPTSSRDFPERAKANGENSVYEEDKCERCGQGVWRGLRTKAMKEANPTDVVVICPMCWLREGGDPATAKFKVLSQNEG